MSVVGQSIHRIDGEEKVTGNVSYTGDMMLPGMIYGKVLRSPFAHARILRIDSQNAATVSGVVSVLTRDNLHLPNPYIGAQINDQPVVALEKVRYAGDIVAAVAAMEEEIAEEAVKRIDVDYEELPAVMTVEDASRETAPLVHESARRAKVPHYGSGATYLVHKNSNICHHFRYQRGEVEKGFAESHFVFEDTFFFPSAHHSSLESSISVARFEGPELTLWTPTQSPFALRQEISRIFGIPLNRIRVIVPSVGGGYGGSKGIITSVLAAALSRIAQKPVHVAFGAEENFKTICQPRAKVTIKTGIAKDGTFVARQCSVYLNGGAYVNSTPSVAEKAGYRACGPYRIPHVLCDAYAIYTNTVPTGSFRGFGGPQVAFAYESHLDMMAHRLGIDAIELRMKNLLGKGEAYAPGDTPMDSDLAGALKTVAESIGWGKENASSTKLGVKVGKGIACAVKDGGGTHKASNATVKILRDGSVLLSFGSVEVGQGVRTAFLQIVADELNIPLESVHVTEIDTRYSPFDQATNASSATAIAGKAVQRAARDAGEQLLSAACSVFGAPRAEITLEQGRLVCRERSMSPAEILHLHFGDTGEEITGHGFFQFPLDAKAPLGSVTPFWEVGFGGAEIELDEMTGEIKILKYVSLTDAGKMIHPLQCEGQDEGAAVFGIGQALFEDLIYEGGQLLNPNSVDYRIPKFRDIPQSFSSIILEGAGGSGPYGAKGMGESGILAVAPAVCNALFNAAGIRINEVPLNPEKVWRAIKGRR